MIQQPVFIPIQIVVPVTEQFLPGISAKFEKILCHAVITVNNRMEKGSLNGRSIFLIFLGLLPSDRIYTDSFSDQIVHLLLNRLRPVLQGHPAVSAHMGIGLLIILMFFVEFEFIRIVRKDFPVIPGQQSGKEAVAASVINLSIAALFDVLPDRFKIITIRFFQNIFFR